MKKLEEFVEIKLQTLFGSAVRLSSLQALAGDASSRRYYRALLEGPNSPQSVIVMELAGRSLPLSSDELALFNEPPKELPFLNLHRFLKQVGVRVPDLYAHWVEERVIFLEDLGDRSLWNEVQGLAAPQVLRWYEKAIDQLTRLQILGTRASDPSCIAFQQRFDLRLYMWEFEHFIEYGIEKRPADRTGKLTKSEKQTLTETFMKIARRLEAQSPCLNHRDYHSWNLMVHNGEVVVIDFQDALLAPPQYDLASLLNDRVTDRVLETNMEKHLFHYYLQKRAEMGEGVGNRDAFFEIYILSALQRDFKVVGRFYYLDSVKGKPGYLKYIPPTLKRLKRNLDKLPYLENLIPILAAHFEEMR